MVTTQGNSSLTLIDVYQDFSKDKYMLHSSNYLYILYIIYIYVYIIYILYFYILYLYIILLYHIYIYYDDSNKLVIDTMKDKTGSAAIEELIRLKPKMYSFLLDDSSEHK